MTMGMILSAMLRRWYVPLAVLALVVVATVMLARDGGIYTTRTVVTFMRPAATSLSPSNGTTDSSIIAFAAAVVQETNNGRPPARYSMEDAPYFGAGVREGVLVELANTGNQWVSTIEKAEIEIHIVGRSYEWVEAKQAEILATVDRIATTQQEAVAASPENQITATVVPLTTNIGYVSPSRTSQVTAAAAMLTVATVIGAWGSVTVDRLLLARRRSTSDATASRASRRIAEGTTS